MVLEVSISLILNPEDWGLFLGGIDVPVDRGAPAAKAYIVKLLPLMFQFVKYDFNDT